MKTLTPLSRAESRLKHWAKIHAARLSPSYASMVGSLSVSIERDAALEKKLLKEAEDAVRDWLRVVNVLKAHDKLINALENATSIMGATFTEENDPEAFYAMEDMKALIQEAR